MSVFPRHAKMVQPVSMVSTHTHVPVVLVSLIADVLQVSTVPQSKKCSMCRLHACHFFLPFKEGKNWMVSSSGKREKKRGI